MQGDAGVKLCFVLIGRGILAEGALLRIGHYRIGGSYLKRMTQSEEIAKAISSWPLTRVNLITGQMLLVDGGFSLNQSKVVAMSSTAGLAWNQRTVADTQKRTEWTSIHLR